MVKESREGEGKRLLLRGCPKCDAAPVAVRGRFRAFMIACERCEGCEVNSNPLTGEEAAAIWNAVPGDPAQWGEWLNFCENQDDIRRTITGRKLGGRMYAVPIIMGYTETDVK